MAMTQGQVNAYERARRAKLGPLRDAHLKRQRAYNMVYHEKNKPVEASYRAGFRRELLELLGNECVRCGFTDPRALQVDHVDGGGHKLRDKERATNQLLKAVREDRGRFQLLCANCNWIKRSENQEYRKRGVQPSQL